MARRDLTFDDTDKFEVLKDFYFYYEKFLEQLRKCKPCAKHKMEQVDIDINEVIENLLQLKQDARMISNYLERVKIEIDFMREEIDLRIQEARQNERN